MTTGLGQNCVTRGRGPLEIPFCKPQIGAKTETWLENSWRRSDNIVGDLEENYGIWIHGRTAARRAARAASGEAGEAALARLQGYRATRSLLNIRPQSSLSAGAVLSRVYVAA